MNLVFFLSSIPKCFVALIKIEITLALMLIDVQILCNNGIISDFHCKQFKILIKHIKIYAILLFVCCYIRLY